MTSATLPRVIESPPTGVVSVFTKHSVSLTFADSAVAVPRRYGNQFFRPEAGCLAFVRSDSTQGGWAVRKAEISGRVIKVGGELGKAIVRRDFADGPQVPPPWLSALIEQHMPKELTA